MLAFTKSSGEPSDAIRSNLSTYNYSQLSQTGYWYKPTDWKNVEITGYFKPLALKKKMIFLWLAEALDIVLMSMQVVEAHRIIITLVLITGRSDLRRKCGMLRDGNSIF